MTYGQDIRSREIEIRFLELVAVGRETGDILGYSIHSEVTGPTRISVVLAPGVDPAVVLPGLPLEIIDEDSPEEETTKR